MPDKDYGERLLSMRISRGLTREQVSEAAGVSVSTIQTLEASGERIKIRASNLDSVLTVLAQRAPLGPSEIKILCDATDRLFESFESINDRADQLKRAAAMGPSPRAKAEPTLEDRINLAVHLLIQAGAGEIVLNQLEALASLYGERIAESERQPPTRRRLTVEHPPRQVGDMVVRDYTHYHIDDEDPQPRQLYPKGEKPPRPKQADGDSDTMNNTGS